jgi:L-amino acid N-acyltransferase YncA
MNISSAIRHRRVYQETLKRYHFRVATAADVDGIVGLWPEHWQEAHYKDRGIVPCEPKYRAWLQSCLTNDLGVWVLAVEDERVVGFFNYELDDSFSERPVAVMGSFFVAMAHRHSAIPAILFELGLDLIRSEGACAIHAPIASETLSSRSLENTFKKHGFTVIGTMMGRAL